jgi:hypoxanthine phosphoribosyltransferase
MLRFDVMPYEAPTNVLISADDIQARVRELAQEIQRDYAEDAQLHLVSVLKGGFIFLGDLIRAMNRQVSIDFMAVSSYGKSTTSSGEVRVLKDLDSGLEGRNVIIVDTGLTLAYLQEILHARSPKTLKTACLLSKPSRRIVEPKVDYVGFTIEDRFVVGYGLDYGELYRNLPYLAMLD